jgi:Na+-translocating ferredoxin:NAD+ oxidoreductase RnfE subunit
MGDKPSDQTCWGTGAIAGIILFLLSNYAQYPDALLLILLITNVSYWAINAKNISLDHIHIATITSHSLLTPILAASAVMVIASSFTQAALVGITVIGIYLGVQSIIDVFKRYIPQSSLLSLVIVLTAFLSTYISLSIKVYLPALSQTIDGAIPLLALSSLILSYSSIFTGNHTPFKMVNALKTSTLFLLLVLLVGGISQFTDLNRIFSAGLFFLFAFIALCNNQKLSTIETTNNKPNRRVRTTGTIK